MTRDRNATDMLSTGGGNVLCNPRDKEAAHRAEMEGIATENSAAVTCRTCLKLLHKGNKARNENEQATKPGSKMK